MADLPFVLAGPIVRRVDPSQVCVWIAFSSEPLDLTLQIVDGQNRAMAGEDASRVQRLGEHLYVALLRRMGLELHRTIDYAYRITATYKDKAQKSVAYDSDLHEPHLRLTGTTRPSFMLPGLVDGPGPAGPRRLRIAHASCRKCHGGGPDALGLLATVLDETVKIPDLRPQQLYLSGDQIYADDVAVEVLRHIGTLVPRLFGWTEPLATATEYKALTGAASPHCTPQQALAGGDAGRGGFLRAIGFKHPTEYPDERDYYDHHLLSFQEWCVMYLLAWSPALWDGFAPVAIPENLARLKAIDLYRNSLPRVRKALANVATYMIFDDHDITDDWFMGAHRELLLEHAAAKNKIPQRIVRNGLLAYGLFQDWGNQPDDYGESGGGRTIFNATAYKVKGAPPMGFEPAWFDEIYQPLGVLVDQDVSPRKYWHYRYDDPKTDFTVIVLDSRTWRGPWVTTKGVVKGEALLTRKAMDLQLDPLVPGRTTILISPAPVSGFVVVDAGQRGKMAAHHVARAKVSEPDDIALDFEGWSINHACTHYLIESFASRGIRPIVLSGDVHYAYSEWAGRKPPPPPPPPPGAPPRPPPAPPDEILQLCCSSAKNAETLTRLLSLTDLLTASIPALLPGADEDANTDSAVALVRMLGELELKLRLDDQATAKYRSVLGMLEDTSTLVRSFLADPVAFTKAHGKAVFDAMMARWTMINARWGSAKAAPLVLAVDLILTRFGDNGLEVFTGSPVKFELANILATRTLIDDRGPARYRGANWTSLDGEVRVPGETAAWYDTYLAKNDKLKGARDRALFLDYYNFLSVGDSNIGLVDITRRSVAHTILWALPDDPQDMGIYGDHYPKAAGGVPAWAVTLHRTDR